MGEIIQFRGSSWSTKGYDFVLWLANRNPYPSGQYQAGGRRI